MEKLEVRGIGILVSWFQNEGPLLSLLSIIMYTSSIIFAIILVSTRYRPHAAIAVLRQYKNDGCAMERDTKRSRCDLLRFELPVS
jgi:hypothetical protein